ncbi:hypothetical protein ElyMa_000779000 [Elysia marginata]|uniref:Uncharacterized protein n=1 Tax=Elysia marginata TaxID=1093978 RepID=A0AAV4GSH6_9GAST|nr:hypothetical protein ElyMa_000779000 [Elysia marginata]
MKQTFVTLYVPNSLSGLFAPQRLTLPEELVKLMEQEEAGAVGRRRVYGRLCGVEGGDRGKGRVVWPVEFCEAVRETVRERLANTKASMNATNQ